MMREFNKKIVETVSDKKKRNRKETIRGKKRGQSWGTDARKERKKVGGVNKWGGGVQLIQ